MAEFFTLANGIIAILLPLLIEFIANKVTGTKKLIIAVVITFLVSVIKVGAEGQLSFVDFDSLLGTFIVILTASQVFWRATFAKLFEKKEENKEYKNEW